MPLPVLPAVIALVVMLTVKGEHTAEGLVITKTGNGLTVTVATAVPVQPKEVPVTVYVVVVIGETSAVFIPVTVAPADQV